MVLLKYKQRETKPNKFIELYGVKQLVSQVGTIDYNQEEEIDEGKVKSRIKELKSFSNRHYHSFTITEIN
jgi:hypothetical protein